MFNISNFFDKFKKIQQNNLNTKEFIIEIIKNKLNIEIKKEDIEIKNSQIKINCNPIVRSEIYMSKQKIESELLQNNFNLKFK